MEHLVRYIGELISIQNSETQKENVIYRQNYLSLSQKKKREKKVVQVGQKEGQRLTYRDLRFCSPENASGEILLMALLLKSLKRKETD